MKTKILALALLCSAPALLQAQQFSRYDDMRIRAPENWKPVKVYSLDLSAGGNYMNGNVDSVGYYGKIDFSKVLNEKNNFYIQAEGNYVKFGTDVVMDKTRGAFLYTYAASPHINLYFSSTHGQNKFLQLKYRTANSVGVCYHFLLQKDAKERVVLSAGPMPEYSSYKNGTIQREFRAAARAIVPVRLSDYALLGTDFMYFPLVADMTDYRTYTEAKAQRPEP
ncbi:MAG: DUF481 domain-containing protein [Elusimicrobia bacterium]|nr:DUF481 domain-containing protein [Elusimicrobiota bacterium]